MNSLFDMVVFDVWESPYVARVFAFWVAGEFPDVGAFEVSFVGIFRWDTDRVEVESVIVAYGPPVYRFVSSGESFGAVQSVSEVPNDAISQL